jgi:hypothetical protein
MESPNSERKSCVPCAWNKNCLERVDDQWNCLSSDRQALMLIPVTKVVSFSFGCALLINSPKNKKLSSHFLDLFCFRSSCQLSEGLVSTVLFHQCSASAETKQVQALCLVKFEIVFL